MASSGSFARGDQPRSVPDPDADAYAQMVARQRAYNAQQEARRDRREESGWADEARQVRDYLGSHPGTAESLIPVWGSAREAIADGIDGNWVGATVNGALALTDLTGEGFVLRDLGKGGLKLVGSNGWKATRKWMGDKGLLEAGQHGHHWLIPRNGWGKEVPDVIKNQPWNIKAMASNEIHGRIHHAVGDLSRFNPVERYWHGTPRWWKTQNGVLAAHGAQGAEEALNPMAAHDR